jgi:hypothetical protein
MQKSRFDSRVNAIKVLFRELDKNKDHMLDFDEMKELLSEEMPEAKERDLKWKFREFDRCNRGKLNLTEFMTYIYKRDIPSGLLGNVSHRLSEESLRRLQNNDEIASEARSEGSEDRSSSSGGGDTEEHGIARHVSCPVQSSSDAIWACGSRSRRNSFSSRTVPTGCETEGIDWDAIENTFFHYAGSDKVMQGNEFARLCRDSRLYDEEYFTPGDAEFIFHRCCSKEQRAMKKKGFRDAMIMIAGMKGVPAVYLRAAISKLAPAEVVVHPTSDPSNDLLQPTSASSLKQSQPLQPGRSNSLKPSSLQFSRPASAGNLSGSIAVALRTKSLTNLGEAWSTKPGATGANNQRSSSRKRSCTGSLFIGQERIDGIRPNKSSGSTGCSLVTRRRFGNYVF